MWRGSIFSGLRNSQRLDEHTERGRALSRSTFGKPDMLHGEEEESLYKIQKVVLQQIIKYGKINLLRWYSWSAFLF